MTINLALTRTLGLPDDTSRQEVLLSIINVLITAPVDIFGVLKHKKVHLLLAKINYLEDKNMGHLIPYTIVQECVKIMRGNCLSPLKEEDLLQLVLDFFNVKEVPSEAEKAVLDLYQMNYYSSDPQVLKEVNLVVELIGLYNPRLTQIYQYIGKYLENGNN